jgi:hypothetical protein
MGISLKTKKQINDLLISTVREKLRTYEPEQYQQRKTKFLYSFQTI